MVHDKLCRLDDDTLARRAAAGDRIAMEALLDRHSRTAARLAYSMLGRHDEALDAAQVALLQVARELPGWKGTSFKGWLYTCVHSAAVNFLRHSAMHARHEERAAAERTEQERVTPERNIERQETLALMREELAALPAETALALSLHHLEGMPVAVVASEAGISIDACKQRMARGREVLRERLQRRGVSLASVALVATLIENLFTSARAWTANLGPHELQRVIQTALGFTSEDLPATPTSGIPGQMNKPQLIRWTPAVFETCILSLLKSKPIIFGVTVLALIAGTVLVGISASGIGASWNSNSLAAKKSLNTTLGQNTKSLAVAESDIVSVTAAASPALVAAPRWAMRESKVSDVHDAPLSISAAGKNVALLTQAYDGLQLIRSTDEGRTWQLKEKEKMSGNYSGGVVSLDEKGGTVVVGFHDNKDWSTWKNNQHQPSEQEKKEASSFEASLRESDSETFGSLMAKHSAKQDSNHFFEFKEYMDYQVDWVLLNGNTPPIRISTSSSTPQLVRNALQRWIFLSNTTGDSVTTRILLSNTGETPHEISAIVTNSIGMGWVENEKILGVVACEQNHLTHILSDDSGNTWKKSEIPCVLDNGCETLHIDVRPVCLDHVGQELLLVVGALTLPVNASIEEKWRAKLQYFALNSKDLGKTWSPPCVLTVPTNWMLEDTEFCRSTHLLRDKLVGLGFKESSIRTSILNEDDDSLDYRYPRIFTSDKSNQTWNEEPLFAGFVCTEDVVSCTSSTLYMAALCLPEEKLVTRSSTDFELKIRCMYQTTAPTAVEAAFGNKEQF